MLSKLKIAKMMRKHGDYYNCSSAPDGTCLVCPFYRGLKSNNPSCITDAREYLEQHVKKIQQWKNINAK